MEIRLTNTQKQKIVNGITGHAHTIEPIATTLLARVSLSTARGHWGSWNIGPNSNYIEVDGVRYYLSARHPLGEIWVSAYARSRKYVWKKLGSRMDAHRMCDELGI